MPRISHKKPKIHASRRPENVPDEDSARKSRMVGFRLGGVVFSWIQDLRHIWHQPHNKAKLIYRGDQGEDIACWRSLLLHFRTCYVRMAFASGWPSAKHGSDEAVVLETGYQPLCVHTGINSPRSSLFRQALGLMLPLLLKSLLPPRSRVLRRPRDAARGHSRTLTSYWVSFAWVSSWA